jgi:hypothetical protein
LSRYLERHSKFEAPSTMSRMLLLPQSSFCSFLFSNFSNFSNQIHLAYTKLLIVMPLIHLGRREDLLLAVNPFSCAPAWLGRRSVETVPCRLASRAESELNPFAPRVFVLDAVGAQGFGLNNNLWRLSAPKISMLDPGRLRISVGRFCTRNSEQRFINAICAGILTD